MKIDTESLIDKRIDQAVEWAKSSQTYGKFTAMATAQVGDYSGATEQIAQRARRGTSTVYNWANAFNLYKLLRKNNRAIARHLWRELPISFWVGADRIEKAGYLSIEYLTAAYQHGWSVRDMNQEFERDREAGNAPLQFKRVIVSLHGLAGEIVKNRNVPQELRQWANEGISLLGRLLEIE